MPTPTHRFTALLALSCAIAWGCRAETSPTASTSVATNQLPLEITIEVEARSLQAPEPVKSAVLDEPPAGLRLLSQGSGAPQQDLSLRGSPFNSTGLLIDGLSLRNPQTEHWHADLPTPATWFAPPTVLTGLDLFRASPGHPSGSVGLELAPLLNSGGSVTTGSGNKNSLFGSATATASTQSAYGATLGTAAALSFDRSDQTDGYRDNHLKRATAATRLGAHTATRQGDLLTALSWREFGARSFYGAAPTYPALERKSDALLFGSLKISDDPHAPAQLSAAWQHTKDSYWLDRHRRSLYQNEHTTDFLALHGAKRQLLAENLSADLRLDGDLESIRSNSLGNHHRSHASLAALPNCHCGPLILTIGGSLELFSATSPTWLPAGGAAWELDENQKLFLNTTTATRQPSYTELNYNLPDSLGNRRLKRQTVRTSELGWLGEFAEYRGRSTLFYEQSHNTVDWIQHQAAGRWESINLRDISAWGLQNSAEVACGRTTDLGANLLVLIKHSRNNLYASRYALDYPQLDGGLSLRHQLLDTLQIKLAQHIGKYAANPARQHSSWYATTAVAAHWQPPFAPLFTVATGISNLFDNNFQTYPSQDPAGRRYHLSLTYAW